ncbi:hypothetical protein FW759_02325 [Psychrobacter sp. 1176_08]|uniref:hypothetical protein n=1 Tax=Psychrobacter sp. 1176_08 TaxID=2604452 RepID=UPI004063E835
MKKLFLTLILLCQMNPAFSYDENTLTEKILSLNMTFKLQSTNFFKEAEKLNKLAEDPDTNPEDLYMLYLTSSQSLCISALSLEKIQNLIKENPQAIGNVLTKDNIKIANDTADIFNKYLKEFEMDKQQCKNQMPYVYKSINDR